MANVIRKTILAAAVLFCLCMAARAQDSLVHGIRLPNSCSDTSVHFYLDVDERSHLKGFYGCNGATYVPETFGGGGGGSTDPTILACGGTNDTTALSLKVAAAGGVTIQPGVICAANTVSLTNVRIMRGGLLKVNTGETVTLTGAFQAGPWQVFSNTLLGTISFAGANKTSRLYAEWWGAVADWNGTTGTNNGPPINSALTAIGTLGGGGTLELASAKRYMTTTELDLINDASHGCAYGFTFLGQNPSGDSALVGNGAGTSIVWNGAGASGRLLKLWSRDVTVKGIGFTVAAGKILRVAVDLDKASAPCHAIYTANTLTDIGISGNYQTQTVGSVISTGTPLAGTGTILNGVRIGFQGFANGEYMRVTGHSYITNITQKGIYIPNGTFQSKSNVFEDVQFNSMPVAIETVTGSFKSNRCGFGNITDSAFVLGSSTDYIRIDNSDAESINRFLRTAGSSPGAWPIAISGGRIDPNTLNADGNMIQYSLGGPLILQNIVFSESYNANFHISAHTFGSGVPVISLGVSYPNLDPFTPGNNACIQSIGDHGIDALDTPTRIQTRLDCGLRVGQSTNVASISAINSVSLLWDPANIVAGGIDNVGVTVEINPGDVCLASLTTMDAVPTTFAGIECWAHAPGQAIVVLHNYWTGGAMDLAEGTLRVVVIKATP